MLVSSIYHLNERRGWDVFPTVFSDQKCITFNEVTVALKTSLTCC